MLPIKVICDSDEKAKIFWNIICELCIPLSIPSPNIASSMRECLDIHNID